MDQNSVGIDFRIFASNIGLVPFFSQRIRPFISESSALQIYQALILPHFDYCSSVWDELNVTLSDKLQKLQNRAARVITRSSYDTSTSFLLKRLHWDDLSTRRKKLKATLMFKTIKGLSPLYLQNLFSIRSTSYNLRDSEIKLDRHARTIASVALTTAGRYYGTVYPSIYGKRTVLVASKGKLIDFTATVSQGPTRQSCKTVYVCMYV